ncbi:uncharacterized protein [Polyergus mexicanus]|uniref:uncharacterized protein n=1 Tax=Polyergus mexicanus TaxID=615972 RepID=UPI0038B67E7F
MRLTAIVYLLTFCGLSHVVSAGMTAVNEPSVEGISWTSWEMTKNNSDVIPDTLEMIRKAGYPAKAHVVTTEDGYLLTLHRIPGGNGSLPVLLQHGLLCTSADWIILGKGKALAYLLADQGYDVWLGNFRGNTYSRAHISLSPSELKFWDFSFNKMGIYDLSAMITFITNTRSQPLHTYIGHSMGTTSFYIMASERPEIARMVKMMISFAPAVFISHMKSPLKYFLSYWRIYQMIMRNFFHDEFLPQGNFLRFLSKYGCDQNLAEKEICAKLIFLICGYDPEQFDYTLLPVILNHDPAGASTKTILHYIQGYQSGKFRQYDYGQEKNLVIYNSPEPPDYDLTNITVPIALFYGPGDWLVNIISEMIRRAGYSVETHVIMTEDGYFLTLHRIPGDNDSVPVLLQHGLFCSSAFWVMLGKGKALAYLLADQGYDVWLGNFRGNTYSRAHISLSPSNSTFWDFSFNELGIYDLPTMITFITNMRSQPLHTYIGHSMGSTSFYVMATKRPEIARIVRMVISLAPTVFMNYTKSPIRYLTFLKDYKIIMQFFFHKFLLSNYVRLFLKYVCNQNISRKICSNVMFMIWGYSEQFNHTLLPVIINHLPAGGSFDTLVHYTQGFQSGKFRQYDYGSTKNLLIYNSVEPPDYDLTNITVPIALFYSSGDTLDDIMDVKKLYRLLPNVVNVYKIPWHNFNHLDFIWAKDAPKLVYERVLKIMKSENLNNVTSMKKCYVSN